MLFFFICTLFKTLDHECVGTHHNKVKNVAFKFVDWQKRNHHKAKELSKHFIHSLAFYIIETLKFDVFDLKLTLWGCEIHGSGVPQIV